VLKIKLLPTDDIYRFCAVKRINNNYFCKLMLHKAFLTSVRDYACLDLEFQGETPSLTMVKQSRYRPGVAQRVPGS
jgi:hypothetical protein